MESEGVAGGHCLIGVDVSWVEYMEVFVEVVGNVRHGRSSGLIGLNASFVRGSGGFCGFVGAGGTFRDNWTGLEASGRLGCDEFCEHA